MSDKIVQFPVVKRPTPLEIAEANGWIPTELTDADIRRIVLMALQAMNEVDRFSHIDAELDLPVKSPSYGWVDQFLAVYEQKIRTEKL